MTREEKQAEFDALCVECLDADGVDTEKLVRLAELEAELDSESTDKTEPSDKAVDFNEFTVAELKDLAKDHSVKGYANMNKAALIEAVEATIHTDGTNTTEPAKPVVPEKTHRDILIDQGHKYLGNNGHFDFFYNKEGKACRDGKNGLEVLGNTFGEKLLKSLKK